jgi:hypothetical protein
MRGMAATSVCWMRSAASAKRLSPAPRRQLAPAGPLRRASRSGWRGGPGAPLSTPKALVCRALGAPRSRGQAWGPWACCSKSAARARRPCRPPRPLPRAVKPLQTLPAASWRHWMHWTKLRRPHRPAARQQQRWLPHWGRSGRTSGSRQQPPRHRHHPQTLWDSQVRQQAVGQPGSLPCYAISPCMACMLPCCPQPYSR